VWGFAELDHRRTDLNPAARRQVRAAEVEIHVQLVAGQGPALALTRDGGSRPRVHQRQLGVRIWPAVGSPAAATREPGVALEAFVCIEASLGQNLALVHVRPAGDQLDCPAVSGCGTNVVETLLEAR